MHRIRQQYGLTLIELMIAMTIGLLIVIGMGSLFIQTKQSFRQNEVIAQMQDEARFGMSELAQNASMTGFWGPLVEGALISNGGGLPGSMTGVTTADLFFYANPALGADNVASNGAFSWTTSLDDFQNGSDALSVYRVAGVTVPEADLEADRYYLQTNGAVGVMVNGSNAPSSSVPTPYEYWEYVPVIFYVRTYCRAGDGTPSLVRRYIRDGAVTTECITQGIESMQIEYGLDVNEDGRPNRYVHGLSNADAEDLAAVRVHLLARATRPDTEYTNDKVYTFGNFTLDKSAATDQFYRRVYTTTIQTRNPTATRLID